MTWLPFACALAAAAGTEPAPISVDACVAIAMQRSARVQMAEADVAMFRAQTDQVKALLSPQVSVLTYGAPLFGAEGGLGLAGGYRSDFHRWGPYVHGEAKVIVPITTFGRLSAGVAAAEGRAAVEAERARETSHAVRLEVRRLFGLRLYALSLKPALENGRTILKEAIQKAEEMYAKGSGEVTLPDVMRLQYGAGEIARFLRQADDGIELAGRALKQAMGLPEDDPTLFEGDRLPLPGDAQPLEDLVSEARRNRPEFAEVRLGRAAAASWESAESKAHLPVLFAAAAGQFDRSPVRPTGTSAVFYNGYNDQFAGAVVGLSLDWNFARARSKAAEARSRSAWIDAAARLAETGIPLQVRKAHSDWKQHADLARIADQEVKDTRKWLAFSAAAYMAGTGEAKEVLEGVGANLLAKKAYYDHLLGAWAARAELEQATGRP